MFILIPHVSASDLFSSRTDYQNQIDNLVNEMQETDEKEELIRLSREMNKLAAYKRAYDKAIELSSMPTAFKATMHLSDIDYAGDLPYINLYKDAALHYGMDWAILAAVHDIETNFSTHPTMISYAGALGHMQFMPGTWDYYGVDANGDGKADPFNIQDAVFSAANYLSASGASDGKIKDALFAYNRSTQYGLEVMAKANKYRLIGESENEH